MAMVDYPRGLGADQIEGYDKQSRYLPTTPTGLPVTSWNLMQAIDPANDAKSYQQDFMLSAGQSLTGRVVGLDGLPAKNVEVIGNLEAMGFLPMKDNKFTIHHYQSGVPRDLFFRSADDSLVGHLHLEGTPPEDLTVRMEPAVTVRGRLIETETEDPAAGYHLSCAKSTRGPFRIDRVITENDGRFEIQGLIAGTVFTISTSSRSIVSLRNGFNIDLTNAKPGDVIELGDATGKNVTSTLISNPKTKP